MQIKQDVAALHQYNFDSWKLDGCGGEKDLVTFNKYMQSYGKPIQVRLQQQLLPKRLPPPVQPVQQPRPRAHRSSALRCHVTSLSVDLSVALATVDVNNCLSPARLQCGGVLLSVEHCVVHTRRCAS
jgi:hypothetical protein